MPGEHVDFVDDVDLVPRRDRAVAHAVDQLAHLVDPGMRGGVHLDHVDVAVLGDRAAMHAFAAGRDRRAAGAVRADAIERAGDDPGRRRLADPAHAGEHEGLRDPPGGNRVRQGADHRLLPDDLGKALRPVLAGEDAVGDPGVAHCLTAGCDAGLGGDVVGRGPAAGSSAGPGRKRWETEQRPRPCTRYGCFLPDLTGLARGLPAADLPPHYIISRHRRGKPRTTAARLARLFETAR